MGRNAILTPDSGRPSKNDQFSCIICIWKFLSGNTFFFFFFFFFFLALFDTFWLFHPKYGLLGLKSSGIARAFIFCDKTSRFLAILAFLHRGRYFFQLFCYFTQSMACDSSNCSELRGRSSRTIKFHDFWLFPIFT